MPVSAASPMNTACAIARDRLNKTQSTLRDAPLWRTMDLVIAVLEARWPCLGDVFALTGADRLLFEGALGLTVAAYLNPGLIKTAATGALLSAKVDRKEQDSEKRQEVIFAPGKVGKTLEEGWLDEAWASLRMVSSIASTLSTNGTSFNVFAAAGPRSLQESQGVYESLNPIYNCLLDERLAPQVMDPLIGDLF